MKRFSLFLSGEVADNVPDDYLDRMMGNSFVQVEEPAIIPDEDDPLYDPMNEVEFDSKIHKFDTAINSFVRTFLDLSTAHLPHDVLMAVMNDDNATIYEHHDYGFFIHVYGEKDEEFPEWWPAELRVVGEYARKLGVDYILFDRDAEIDEHLPTWEW